MQTKNIKSSDDELRFKTVVEAINGFDFSDIDLTKPLNHYSDIMREKSDTSNRDFQRSLNGFYRVRRKQPWLDSFYSVFGKMASSTEEITFEKALWAVHEKTGRIECSFTSKMLHTINPDKPIWDKNVLKVLDLYNKYKPYKKSSEDKIKNAVEVYGKIEEFYNRYLATEDFKTFAADFDANYPQYKDISNVKKVDFALWKIGDKL